MCFLFFYVLPPSLSFFSPEEFKSNMNFVTSYIVLYETTPATPLNEDCNNVDDKSLRFMSCMFSPTIRGLIKKIPIVIHVVKNGKNLIVSRVEEIKSIEESGQSEFEEGRKEGERGRKTGKRRMESVVSGKEEEREKGSGSLGE